MAILGGERLRYPTGAHYLPLPSMESMHVRTMLADFTSVDEAARVSQLTSPSFDAYLRDVFTPLCAGGTVCARGVYRRLFAAATRSARRGSAISMPRTRQ